MSDRDTVFELATPPDAAAKAAAAELRKRSNKSKAAAATKLSAAAELAIVAELREQTALLVRIHSMLDHRLPRPSRTRLPKNGHPLHTDTVPYKGIVDTFHEMLPAQPRLLYLDARRRKMLSEFWHRFDDFEGGNMEGIRGIFELFQRAEFLIGKRFATLDWMLEPEHFTKIREGYYNAKELFR